MGMKSSKAPPPDPRLVDAQIRSMGVQEDAIGRMLALSEEMQPLQKEQMRFGLDAAKQGYQDSRDDRTYSLGRRAALSGVQDRMISDANNFNTEDRRAELAGESIANVRQGFGVARGTAARTLMRMGVNPNSGKFGSMIKQLAADEALGSAAAGTQASRSARTEGYALTDRAANALSGYPAMSMANTGAGAQMAASGINMVNAGVGGMNAGNTSAANAAAQWGSNATGMWGQQAGYKNNADEQARMRFKDGLGNIASAAGMVAQIMGSARAYKQAINRIGTHPAGFGIYEFEYRESHRAKWGAGRHVGVMADEVAGVIPGAVLMDADGDTVVNYAML